MFTFLFTDIEGSTALLQRVGGDVYARVLADHHGLIRLALAGHGGSELNTAGDGFFAGFSSPRECVAAALEMQRALGSHAWPGGERVRVRMGVHAGEASETAVGPVGLDVHRAARVAAVGHGGQVLVSETATALVRDALPPGVALVDLGVHQLKDLGRPERIFQLSAPGLQAGFPPLRSLGNPALQNNLPAQLATFVGRERELSDVRALVGSSRLVTLTGAGGAGKTRLGLQVAAELLDGSGDGAWLVELAAVSGEDAVAPAICEALGIAAQRGRPALETLLDALAFQDVLVVLDNCEHLIGGCAKTADAVVRRCPRVRLLATSREPLGISGEMIYRVPPLSLPGPGDDDSSAAGSCDAVALFVERARAQGVSLPVGEETGPLVVSVCARLDGLPLAIELAAARLRSLSLGALADRLDQRFGLLTGGSRTAAARQQTLQATIEWSYALLNRAEQLLLGRLAVFAESFDLDAAEQVCGFGGVEACDVAGLLGSLVDKSLVVAGPAGPGLRYRLLETIRQFAASRLTDADEAAAVAAAHCAYYLSVAETAAPQLTGPDVASWLARLDADQANLRRAAEPAAGRPDGTAQVLRFGAALWPYWIARSRNEEAAGLLLPALRRPEAAADPALFAEALARASLLTAFTDTPASLQLAEQADQVAGRLGDDRLLVLSRQRLCYMYYFAGEGERAPPLGADAVQRSRQLGDDVLLIESLLAHAISIDPPGCLPLYAEALACAERSGHLGIQLTLHNNAGADALEMGDLPAARAHLEAGIRAAEALGSSHLPMSVNLGEVMRAEHDLHGARSTFEEVVRIARRTGDKHNLAMAILGLACLAADLRDWHRAATLHGIAQALTDQTGTPWEPCDERRRQVSLGQARQGLGGEQLQRAYTRGMTLRFDQAIDLALGGVPPAT